MAKKLKVVGESYRGWASKEAFWQKGDVVEVDDQELHTLGDMMITLYDYLRKRPEFDEVRAPARGKQEAGDDAA